MRSPVTYTRFEWDSMGRRGAIERSCVNVVATPLPGVLIVEPRVFHDDRGFFLESYQHERYARHGIPERFVQDNHSRSVRGTLRGLHSQRRRPQAKLVRAIEGEIFDVAVDARPGSAHFGRWFGVRLSGENFRQLYLPAGFLHGFQILSDSAHVQVKCADVYAPDDEFAVAWDDPRIGIAWPLDAPILSARDAAAGAFAELFDELPGSKMVEAAGVEPASGSAPAVDSTSLVRPEISPAP